MLDLNDLRWQEFDGGYRTPFDPRPALRRLEEGSGVDGAWLELWDNLHHQGDVGLASYAAVPQLVRIFGEKERDYNLYGLVATIEIERWRQNNPPLPDWLAQEYGEAPQRLVGLGSKDLPNAGDRDTVVGILAAIASAKGYRAVAEAVMMDEEDLQEVVGDYLGAPHETSDQ